MAEMNVNSAVDMGTVAQHMSQISKLGGLLGAKYFMLEGKDTWTDFDKKQRELQLNPKSPELILNKSPRKYEIRDFDVIAQSIKTNPLTGVTSVVFNPGTSTEAEASIVAGNAFAPISDDALAAALTPGAAKHIFANGRSLLNKVNIANQQNVDMITALIKILQAQKDSIISTMKANEKKVNDYEENLLKSKKELENADNGSVEVIIGQS
jgi:hypothetical protein